MNKNKYLILGSTILVIVAVIIIILVTGNKKTSWQDEVLNSDKYTITMEDCNERKVELPSDTVKEIFAKWDKLSNNGPWTGNNDGCFQKVTITFEKGAVVKNYEILLIDETSLVLNFDNNSTYYNNGKEIITYLEETFINIRD